MHRIMLVDDEVLISMQLEAHLTAMGYEIVGSAISGEEAIEVASCLRPDLILMDIVMPGELDGITAAERIKASLDIPVIFLTAYMDDSFIERAKNAEPFGYITKPFHKKEIKAAIEVALYKKEMERRLRDSEERYRTVIEHSSDGVAIIQDERYLYVNHHFVRMLGYESPEELIGKPFFALFHSDERRNRKDQALLKDEAKPSSCTYEARAVRKDGETIYVEASTTQTRYQGNVVTIAFIRDITDRKHTERSLQKIHNELERRVEERTVELVTANEQLKREIEERKRMEQALRRSEEQLRLLSSHLLTVQEKERKQIAHELHDSIGQSLSAIKFGVENALYSLKQKGNDAAQPEMRSLEAVVVMIQLAIGEIRKIYMDLRPSVLDDFGIIATIQWFCRQFQTIYSNVCVEIFFDIEEEEIPEPLKIVIFRIVQEAFHNIAKYSKAELVNLSFTKKDASINLTIEDNGVGFDVNCVPSKNNPERGLGLTSMKERAELSGGSFTLESVKQEGTTIEVSWPCKA